MLWTVPSFLLILVDCMWYLNYIRSNENYNGEGIHQISINVLKSPSNAQHKVTWCCNYPARFHYAMIQLSGEVMDYASVKTTQTGVRDFCSKHGHFAGYSLRTIQHNVMWASLVFFNSRALLLLRTEKWWFDKGK